MNQVNHFRALTGKGTRSLNEDAVYPNTPMELDSRRLFMICDGVGGRDKGEVASQQVIEFLSSFLENLTTKFSKDLLFHAVVSVKKALDSYSRTHPFSKGMATTLALLYLQNTTAFVVHLGDSRVYQIRDNRFIFKTKDHSLVNELLEKGTISQEEAVNYPKKNVITRALVANPDITVVPEITEIKIENGDLFLLCSDGVLEGLHEKQLLELLSNPALQLAEKKQLIEDACQAFANDNYSAVIIEVKR